MTLLLNWFRCDFNPTEIELSVRSMPTVEAAVALRKTDASYANTYMWVSRRPSQSQVALVFVDGRNPAGTQRRKINLLNTPSIAKRVIRSSLIAHFRTRQLLVEEESHGAAISAFGPGTTVGKWVRIRTGIQAKPDRPFFDGPVGVIFQWNTKREIEGSLADSDLASIAVGLSCMLNLEGHPVQLSQNVLDCDGRLLGTVKDISNDDCRVKLRRGGEATVPRRFLRLTPNSTTVSRVEQLMAPQSAIRPVWNQTQRAALTLGKDNRRNANVLRDRLDGVRTFLGGPTPTFLVIPLVGITGQTLTIQLEPAKVESEGVA